MLARHRRPSSLRVRTDYAATWRTARAFFVLFAFLGIAHNSAYCTTPPGGLYDINGRRVSNVISSIRHISETQTMIPVSAPPNTTAPNETDNNADTCVLGKNFLLLNVSGRVADVFGFKGDSSKPDEVHIGSAVTAYDHPDGYTMLLTIHEALWYGQSMNHSLINPNQLRAYGIQYWDNPYDHTKPLAIEIDDLHSIPLMTQGTKVLFSSRVPTNDELVDPNLVRIELTSTSCWEPTKVQLANLTSNTKTSHPPPSICIVAETSSFN